MKEGIQSRLGEWYDRVARDLPWRRTSDPYAIWVSEVMLQQTRVETAVPYFERFMRRYPDVATLARSSLDEVLSLWSGLGYYRRARVMHEAAREVADRRGGVFPDDVPDLRSLPGIGAYTAGAVASIAYGRRVPLVDGNVARVLSRLHGIDDDPKSPAGLRRLWALAEGLVPEDRPGRFNQALMELGATVCLPRAPRCDACPIARPCVARREHRQAELPRVAPARARPSVAMVAAVVYEGECVLLARRAEGGLFGGLWEPPMVEARSLRAAAARWSDAGVELAPSAFTRAGRVKHVLTHRELDVLVARAEVGRRWRARRPTSPSYVRTAWVDVGSGPGLGMSTLARKVLAVACGSARARSGADA